VFVTLPLAFGNISGGLVLGTLFFLLLSFAALTSSISLLEPVVELLEERTPLNRFAATLVAGLTIWALGIAAMLSFNLWSEVKLAGLNIFDLLDYLTSKFMLPLAGLGAIVFAAWKLEQSGVKRELRLGDTGFALWTLLSRYVAPLGVLYVFWNNL
jgi:NSS family neurotransmitter:Na+ symporter